MCLFKTGICVYRRLQFVMLMFPGLYLDLFTNRRGAVGGMSDSLSVVNCQL